MSALNNPIKLLYMQPFFDVFGCALSFGSFDFLSPVLADVQALNQHDTDSLKHYGDADGGQTDTFFLTEKKHCGLQSVESVQCGNARL